MTALKAYQRLESIGLWRANAEDQRKEVVVSFGDATLVISDTAGRPLTHWSLSAVVRRNSDLTPAIYGPAIDGTETLEIEDAEMISAIETVQAAVDRARPRPGRLRWTVRLALPAALLCAALIYGPTIVINQTTAVVPPAKRTLIGQSLLANLERDLGPACESAAGSAAADALYARLLGTGGKLVILRTGLGLATSLPGGTIALDQSLIENVDDPLIVAGHVLAAQKSRELEDPLAPLLRSAGVQATLQLLTSGELPESAITNYAVALQTATREYPALDELQERFDRADLAAVPFFKTQSVAVEAETTRTPKPVLSDGQWVALQGICLD